MESAMRILDRHQIEKVAEELEDKRKLTFEEVASIIGFKLPWE